MKARHLTKTTSLKKLRRRCGWIRWWLETNYGARALKALDCGVLLAGEAAIITLLEGNDSNGGMSIKIIWRFFSN